MHSIRMNVLKSGAKLHIIISLDKKNFSFLPNIYEIKDIYAFFSCFLF